jgi:hypothetical protein
VDDVDGVQPRGPRVRRAGADRARGGSDADPGGGRRARAPGFARCDGWSFTVYLREIEDGSLAGVTSSHEGFEQDLSDIGFFVFLDDPDIEDDFTLDELDRCVARSAFAFTATDPVDTVLDLEVLAIGASTRTDLATVTAEIGWLD